MPSRVDRKYIYESGVIIPEFANFGIAIVDNFKMQIMKGHKLARRKLRENREVERIFLLESRERELVIVPRSWRYKG